MQLSNLVDKGAVEVTQGLSLVDEENPESEELEFETSWQAASLSAVANNGWGFVLVTERDFPGTSLDESGQWSASFEIALSEVECLLVAAHDDGEIEEELSWFAVQEIAEQLPAWLSKSGN
jgi:hypothetical protein